MMLGPCGHKGLEGTWRSAQDAGIPIGPAAPPQHELEVLTVGVLDVPLH